MLRSYFLLTSCTRTMTSSSCSIDWIAHFSDDNRKKNSMNDNSLSKVELKKQDKGYSSYTCTVKPLPFPAPISRNEAFFDSKSSFSLLAAIEASSVFLCRNYSKQIRHLTQPEIQLS